MLLVRRATYSRHPPTFLLLFVPTRSLFPSFDFLFKRARDPESSLARPGHLRY